MTWSGNRWTVIRGLAFALFVVFRLSALAQTCFTSEDMDRATRSALESSANRYFEMIVRGDAASLKQSSIPAVARDFTSIENTIKASQASLSGAHAAPRPAFLLKAEGTAPLAKAEFLCGVFGPTGQTSNSAEFIIPNLPPGNYGVITLDVSTQKSPYMLSFVLEQQGADWKLAGLYLRPADISGHDSNWFLSRARTFKSKGQLHNAWLYFLQGSELAVALPFMYTQATDKLYEETQSVKPADFPVDGKIAELAAPGAKTYKLIDAFPLAVGQDLDLVVKYQNANVSDTGQAFQDNIALMKAVLLKFPELREAFAGIVARGVEASGRDYGTMMPMKDIK